MADNSKIFDRIYKFHYWGRGSGTGAVYELNKPFVNFVNDYLKEHKKDIKTVVEIGCGDWQLSSHFDLENIQYIGCEVSEFMFNKLSNKHTGDNIRFEKLDAVSDPLPEGDILICKDVLQHLCNEDVLKILKKMESYKYVILVNDYYDTKRINKNIRNGSWRALDFSKPPFYKFGYLIRAKYIEGAYKSLNRAREFIGMKPIEKAIFIKK